ncbi:hypothetical protein [Pyxidicoccus trucidator]|uniref:hypothetical protein n=1 Tax=Pyxidicoccus trucidator TaxID=2709662 RepID=UPI0013DC3469|nr:hypothetical protein [Pyxidicoccus trucidator]
MKIVGPRQSPVSSPASPESSSGGPRLSDKLAREILTGTGKKDGVSGSALKVGGGHSDNLQTAAYEPKKDEFDPAVKRPGKWSPIRIGGGHADNISKVPNESSNKPRDTDSGAPAARPSFPGAIGRLLQRLFPRGLPGPLMDRGDRPGGAHANNILMNAPPEKRGIE